MKSDAQGTERKHYEKYKVVHDATSYESGSTRRDVGHQSTSDFT